MDTETRSINQDAHDAIKTDLEDHFGLRRLAQMIEYRTKQPNV
ncbi:predicted protein [Plenodomus lingam JN3]|uniref:Predicted protein n=1 Tax=Leptosphaeria maculans (strain JN3 / isolate v23.1.3 / race Av1-4-5-6-7-8) TaxID=985895 RepID=E4ZT99_LEPMJ|nr:predicted protein [Plenodomus lingam JN3]CBX90041.1 predicted protein [Plenodomus lingam JN3]